MRTYNIRYKEQPCMLLTGTQGAKEKVIGIGKCYGNIKAFTMLLGILAYQGNFQILNPCIYEIQWCTVCSLSH